MKDYNETFEPLLSKNSQPLPIRNERKRKGKIFETLKTESLNLNLNNYYKEKDSKAKKIESKFIFKVYLHLFCQVIFEILIIIFSFSNKAFNNFLSHNKIVFFIFILITFISIIHPLYSDQILKIIPYNYIYLFVFTLSISYILCKIFIMFNSSLVKIGVILFSLELIYLTVEAYINEKSETNIVNNSIFIGLCLFFIGFIFYFIEKIIFLKIIIIIIIILIFGIYLIYDMNLLFLDKKNKYEEKDYVLATIFVYIDFFQTIFDLIGKFYNSCEPERKPIKRHDGKKSMIYIGEEEYENLYNPKEDEDNKEEDEENKNDFKMKRTNSDIGLKIKLNPNMIIKEENENEDEDEEDNDRSFKHKADKKLEFDKGDE